MIIMTPTSRLSPTPLPPHVGFVPRLLPEVESSASQLLSGLLARRRFASAVPRADRLTFHVVRFGPARCVAPAGVGVGRSRVLALPSHPFAGCASLRFACPRALCFFAPCRSLAGCLLVALCFGAAAPLLVCAGAFFCGPAPSPSPARVWCRPAFCFVPRALCFWPRLLRAGSWGSAGRARLGGAVLFWGGRVPRHPAPGRCCSAPCSFARCSGGSRRSALAARFLAGLRARGRALPLPGARWAHCIWAVGLTP